MSQIEVKAGEHGVVRVLAAELPMDEVRARYDKTGCDRLAALFGIEEIDPDYVDLIDPSGADGLALSTYLVDGIGLPEELVAPEAAKLDALGKPALVISSPAFKGEAVKLNIQRPFELVATFEEPVSVPSMEPLRSAGAVGTLDGESGRAGPSDAAMMGRVATIALLVIFVLVAVMIWIAG